jgi:carbohydrate kinase (thermoresistant glucokinase family)
MAELAGIVVMGVAGSGKSTVGVLLAERLGWPFGDADEFHPPSNIEKMRSGVPLTDDDRWPWLEAIAAWIDEGRASGKPRVVGCSALKRRYRDVLTGGRRDVRLVYLQGTKAVIAARMAARRDHFMPPALLDSQFAALEEPAVDENALVVAIEGDPAAIVEAILQRL